MEYQHHPGPIARGKRMAAGVTMTKVAYEIRADLGRMSRFEKGLANLTPQQMERLNVVLDQVLASKRREINALATA